MLGKILKAMYLTFKAMIGIPIAVAVTSAAVMFAGFSSLWAGAASHIKKSKFGRNKNTPGDESRNALRDSLWGFISGVWGGVLSGATEVLTFVGVSTSDSRNLDPTENVPGKIEIPSSDEKKDASSIPGKNKEILGDLKNNKGPNNIDSGNKKVLGKNNMGSNITSSGHKKIPSGNKRGDSDKENIGGIKNKPGNNRSLKSPKANQLINTNSVTNPLR